MSIQQVSASALVMDKYNRVLFVKRAADDDFLPGIYELPGGGIDYQEDPKVGLKRELFEECGIEIDVDHPLTTFSFTMPIDGQEVHRVEIIYLCFLTDDSQEIVLSHEHSDHMWLALESIESLETTDFLINLIKELTIHPIVSTKSPSAILPQINLNSDSSFLN